MLGLDIFRAWRRYFYPRNHLLHSTVLETKVFVFINAVYNF